MTDLSSYLDYIRNTGRDPLPIEMFDEDWEPIGPIVRQEMMEQQLVIEVEGGLRIASVSDEAVMVHAEPPSRAGTSVLAERERQKMEALLRAAFDAGAEWGEAAATAYEHGSHAGRSKPEAFADFMAWDDTEPAKSLSSLCVGVKLEWEELPDRDGSVFEARHPFGSYVVQDMRGERPHVIVYSGHRGAWGEESPSGTQFPTLEAAQQACQSDFASRWAACGNIRTEQEVRAETLAEASRALKSEANNHDITTRAVLIAAAHTVRSLVQEGK